MEFVKKRKWEEPKLRVWVFNLIMENEANLKKYFKEASLWIELIFFAEWQSVRSQGIGWNK